MMARTALRRGGVIVPAEQPLRSTRSDVEDGIGNLR
jgi:hypothetical protein